MGDTNQADKNETIQKLVSAAPSMRDRVEFLRMVREFSKSIISERDAIEIRAKNDIAALFDLLLRGAGDDSPEYDAAQKIARRWGL